MSDVVRYEVDGDVAVVTMDDGRVNALSPSTLAALDEAVTRAADDGKALVLAGRPGRFSAGFDLTVIQGGGLATVEMLATGFGLAHRLVSNPLPVVIACTGHAIAMGSFLTIAGDHRIGVAGGTFRIQANEVAIGMAMPRTPIVLCRERLTPSAFQQALVLAQAFSHEEARAAGWLDELVPADDVVTTAAARAAGFMSTLHPAALALTKRRVRASFVAELERAIAEDDADLRAML